MAVKELLNLTLDYAVDYSQVVTGEGPSAATTLGAVVFHNLPGADLVIPVRGIVAANQSPQNTVGSANCTGNSK